MKEIFRKDDIISFWQACPKCSPRNFRYTDVGWCPMCWGDRTCMAVPPSEILMIEGAELL